MLPEGRLPVPRLRGYGLDEIELGNRAGRPLGSSEVPSRNTVDYYHRRKWRKWLVMMIKTPEKAKIAIAPPQKSFSSKPVFWSIFI
jgi:hypothetical protein